MQQSGLKCVQPAVVSFDIVIVLLAWPWSRSILIFSARAGIVGRDRACLAASAQVLARIETECRCATHRACFHPAIVLSGKIFSAMGLASIFDHDETVSFRQFLNRIHVRHLAIEMDWNDGGDRAPAATADEFARFVFRRTASSRYSRSFSGSML